MTFTVVVPLAGVYPFRLVWENGNGGALLEWYAIDAQGQTNLINDANAPTAIKAYRTVSALPAYVSSVYPEPGDPQVPGNADILIGITDGVSPLSPASVALQFNGQVTTLTPTKSGNVTTLKAASTSLLPPGSTNSVTLIYSDSASPAHVTTNQWSFQVAPIQNLTADQASAVGSGDSTAPGFKARMYQVDQVGTTGDH